MKNAINMTTAILNQTGYIFNSYDNSIEEINYRDYLKQYGADETTSPRGVESRIHIREIEGAIYEHLKTKEVINGDDYDNLSAEEQDDYRYDGETIVAWELWSWGVTGNKPYKIASYDNEEEAENEIYEYREWYIREKNWNAPIFFGSKEELMQQWADLAGKPLEVIERYVRLKEYVYEKESTLKKELAKKELEFRTIQSAVIKSEAELLTPDAQLIEELKAIYADPKQYSGNEKSEALSSSFVAFLNRFGHIKIQSDFWKVFRIVSKKATSA